MSNGADQSIQRAIAAVQAARARGDRAAEIALLDDALRQAPEHPQLLNARGMAALNDAAPGPAATFFRRAIAADPTSPDLLMNLAKALRLTEDTTGELAALQAALAIDRRHFMAIVRLAELFERTGDRGQAAERWGEVLALGRQIEQPAPALRELLAHAAACVAAQNAGLAAAVDVGLAAMRDTLDHAARRRVDACIDHALGRRRIFANECHGLHFPFLPADEFFDRAHFPWLAEIEGQTAAIRAEFEAQIAADGEMLRPYVAMEAGIPANKWSPLDHSLDWGALHLWKDGQRDDAVCARFPHTAAAVERLPLSDLPGRTPTVFFSVLQPGTHLPAHSGVSNVRAIIHLPLIVPPGCTFRVGGETRDWVEGAAWAFDDTIEHEAWNRSDRVRAILIFDVWNPHIAEAERAILREFYTVAAASGTNASAIGVSD